jgi:hypothetical protein
MKSRSQLLVGCCLTGASILSAAPLQLSVDLPAPELVRLRASAAAGANVHFEASFDLTEWFLVRAVPAAGGAATLALRRGFGAVRSMGMRGGTWSCMPGDGPGV